MGDFMVGLVLGAYNRVTHDAPVTTVEVLDVLATDDIHALMGLFEDAYLRGYQQGVVDGVTSVDSYNAQNSVCLDDV